MSNPFVCDPRRRKLSMELVRGLHNLGARHRGCVATLGNYDGVHLGHREVLRQLGRRAAELSLPSTVVIFEPTPQEFFAPDRAPPRITGLRDKLARLAETGVDRVLCLCFGRALADMEAEAFIDRVLVRGLGVHHLVVGDDFRFGRGRRGDFEMLRRAGAEQGFEVARMPTYNLGGERVSSTRVRDALGAGDMDEAERLLGSRYTVSGRVVCGERLGTRLGYPTANVRVPPRPAARKGVYLVAARDRDGGVSHDGVASLGTRPTVGGREMLLEVYLLDFPGGELYRRHLSVEMLEFLRDEASFDSVEELTRQMDRDVTHSRHLLARRA